MVRSAARGGFEALTGTVLGIRVPSYACARTFCVCMYKCMYVCLFVCMSVLCIGMYVCVYIYICMYVDVCMCMCACTDVWRDRCVLVYVRR